MGLRALTEQEQVALLNVLRNMQYALRMHQDMITNPQKVVSYGRIAKELIGKVEREIRELLKAMNALDKATPG